MLTVTRAEFDGVSVRAAHTDDLGRIVALPDLCEAIGLSDPHNVVRLALPRFGDVFHLAEDEVPFVQIAFIGLIGERLPQTLSRGQKLFRLLQDHLDTTGAPPMPTCTADELDLAVEGEVLVVDGRRFHIVTLPERDRVFFLKHEVQPHLRPLEPVQVRAVLVGSDFDNRLVVTMGGIDRLELLSEAALRRLAMISGNPGAQEFVSSLLRKLHEHRAEQPAPAGTRDGASSIASLPGVVARRP
jgi:hypothetical protein